MHKGVEEMNKALGRAVSEKNEGTLPQPGDIMQVLKSTLEDLTKAYGASKTAEIIRDILSPPRNETPSPFEALRGLKDMGLDFGTVTSSYKDAASVWQALFSETRKEAEQAKKEAAQANNNLIALAIAAMSSEQRRTFDELLRRLEDNKKDSTISKSLEEVVAKVLAESIARTMMPEKQTTPVEEALLRQLELFDKLQGWLKRREEEMTRILPSWKDSGISSVDFMRMMLEDERDKLRIKLEDERKRQELEMRQRSMNTIESIAEKLVPLIGPYLESRRNSQGVQPQPPPQPQPSLQDLVKQAVMNTSVAEI